MRDRRWNWTGAVTAIVLAAVAGILPAADTPADALSYPRVVLLIRHAEKPAETAVSPHLSAEGTKRAEALPKLFEASPTRADPYPKPEFIFAARESRMSNRCVETVTPLAKHLKLEANSHFANEEFAKLAYELVHKRKYADKTVLVCWHHGLIPALAGQLKAADFPEVWKAQVFDRVWEISFGRDGRATWRDRPQQLLPGDSAR
jgi:broad specificity phosphatase PhoE